MNISVEIVTLGFVSDVTVSYSHLVLTYPD